LLSVFFNQKPDGTLPSISFITLRLVDSRLRGFQGHSFQGQTMAAPYVVDSLNPSVAAPATVAPASRKLHFPGKTVLWSAAALLASLLALPLAVTFDGRFPVENLDVDMTNRIRNNRNDPIAWAKERSNRWESMYQTTVACLTGFGALLGGVATWLGTSSTVPIMSRMRWLFAGVLLGAISAAIGGYLEAGLLIKIEKITLDPMLRTILGHAVAWSVIAAAVAMAATFSVPGWKEKFAAIGRACGGALIGAAIYTPSAAILFQLLRSDLPIPEGFGNKLLFLGTAGMAIFGMLGSSTAMLPAAAPSTSDQPTNLVTEGLPAVAA
jgi:hypothetical protein